MITVPIVAQAVMLGSSSVFSWTCPSWSTRVKTVLSRCRVEIRLKNAALVGALVSGRPIAASRACSG